MFGLSKMLRVGEGRAVKRLKKIADDVIALEADYTDLTDEELKAKTHEFQERIAQGESVDDLLLEAFAVAREASWRVLGQKHYPVQIMGGAALHFGNVAEMRTGEGKTLTCVLPAYLNALEGKGVHVVTVNDYLAKRDAEWMGRVHRWLGLNVGVILANMQPAERREAYNADITYGTNNELGFDYLRDNMVRSLDELVQRGHHYAIVDEVDSILIDEARTPLIISGPVEGSSQWYSVFAQIVPRMTRDIHYEVDNRKRTVGVREEGVAFVEDQLGIDNLYAPEHSQLVSYLNNAIKAKELFNRDKDYIVRNGEVLIVDDFTGRVLDGRRYNEGMHQAIEAKENVEIKNENQTLATITLQNYFRLYDKLSGMTGTAETEASELHQIYKLDVIPIPTNRPNQREDMTDLVYKTQEAKFAAVVDDISERVAKGQPVLVGTTSVERSEYLSQLLQRRGIKHSVLNAKFHEQEAQIVAKAGLPGAVTVATNMAGRGTDIVLGGNADIIADINLRERGLNPVDTPEEYEAAWDAELARVKEKGAELAEEVREAGGLYVLGTERHESRRIDNQLRGRAGRQGDPGTTRFYLSMRDDLMVRFVGQTMENMMNRLNVPDDVPIEAKMVTNSIKSAQTSVENQNFEMRKNVLKYDEVMNEQRKVIYTERREILESADIAADIQKMIDDTIGAYVDAATATGYVEDWDLETLWNALESLYGPSFSAQELIDGDAYGESGELSASDLRKAVLEDAHKQYTELEENVTAIGGEAQMRNIERMVILPVIDTKWREHLYEMDYLKEGIGLRAMAQRDPLVEYQKEGGDMFNAMKDAVKEETVRQLFLLRKQFAVANEQPAETEEGTVEA
ncbi:preprotein translocase subunit SecA [Corynebacterium diphtheriae]|uniref:preprotein translocase subunit SecA n=1 Tax=Corynebacterium diphtheriae TaxID=1717 RepID=UPI000B4BF803|nr:preprotein translocase subunit SecA [Corynebacterium diphtheriae]OWM44195.1 preprotein translocase subunit SecA [Corynebacterium diphtheriae]OWM50550.1 preprotein translocase subunit SecA [Corynebacterium diphtheriae]OWN44949.1 preprotein translocase subunit SecA [Corynebacterium diphtheriae bv. mitis]OWN63268.1 preprotein translocase subunit SecA [Corynebacterium diphtheriae bv. mitis]OWN79778.1 preprotein translocase subunit SecA [Corynebacterium diphtheriae bv. mitis]